MERHKNILTPMRPPRGTKVSKDTTGRLMNIIAELSVSKDAEDRKRKKAQLEKDFKASDTKLNQLVTQHWDELSKVMDVFSAVSNRISVNRQKCKSVLEKLTNCKKLLQCKRDELRRLWLEAVEHKEVLNMLQEIEELKQVSEKVQDFLSKKDFLQATEVLVSAITCLEQNLAGIDALKDLATDLYALRETLHQALVRELHIYLYVVPTRAFEINSIDPEESSYEDVFGGHGITDKIPVIEKNYDDKNDPNFEYITTILKCVCLLNRLPETVEVLKYRCQKELMAIIRNTSQLMHDILKEKYSYTFSVPTSFWMSQNQQQQRFLLDLVDAILYQFRLVAINQQSFLCNLKHIMAGGGDVVFYEMPDVYSQIQTMLEVFVGDYGDVHNTTSIQHRTTVTFAKVSSVTDISPFFVRKSTKPKKNLLFKFDSSSHAINMKSYLQEKKVNLTEMREFDSGDADQLILICQPTAKNITIIFKSVRKFISEIEQALHMEHGAHCPLHNFLFDCVKLFLDQVNVEINKLIDKTTNSLEIWKAVSTQTHPDDFKEMEVKTPILNSTMTFSTCMKELERLISCLPDFANHFLQLISNVLQTYKDMCNAAYKSLIYSDTEDLRVFSVSWARDEDISRLLRSLPNWTNLQMGTDDLKHDFEESPEEVRFRNKEELELLIRNLSFKESISICEILSDTAILRNLSLMHESMEWFSREILAFIKTLPDIQDQLTLFATKEKDEMEVPHDITIAVNSVECLEKLAHDFEDLADTCLLVLHLEVRAHCFYHLLPLAKQGSYVNRKDDQEPEPEVVKLNMDLSKIDEALVPILQPRKIKYIFEGLGELLSTILINSVSKIKKINENGVKKMGRNIFAIQQNLASITMTREVALDRARQYFDLLNHTFEDILNQIVEAGPQFQENEYSAIMQLLHNSKEGSSDVTSISSYLEKLRQILDEVAVSV